MTTTMVSLGYLPKSFNRTGHAHWGTVHRAKQQLQHDLEMVMLGKVPRDLERVEATAVLLVPDRRRRDVDNYRTPLSKALGDAMVRSGRLPDDGPEHFAFGDLSFEHVPGVQSTRIFLSWPASTEVAA